MLTHAGEKYCNGDFGFLRQPQNDHRGKGTRCHAQARLETIDVGKLAPLWLLYVVVFISNDVVVTVFHWKYV